MVTIVTVSVICYVWAGLDIMYALISLLDLTTEIVPYGEIYDLLAFMVSGVSLAANIMMLKAVNYGKIPQVEPNQDAAVPEKSLKMMGQAVSIKLFVIIFEFLAPAVYLYNAVKSQQFLLLRRLRDRDLRAGIRYGALNPRAPRELSFTFLTKPTF
ncbi:uncharacterized protein LOC144120012 [Amblyomma americanum]